MSECAISILGNVQDCRTEAEVSCVSADGSYEEIATVFETADGWQVRIYDETLAGELGDVFDAAIERAKESLRDYVNRLGLNPPDGLTMAGLSLWLMEKSDGTAMGQPIP